MERAAPRASPGGSRWARGAVTAGSALALALAVAQHLRTLWTGRWVPGCSTELRLDAGDRRHLWFGFVARTAPTPEPARSRLLAITSRRAAHAISGLPFGALGPYRASGLTRQISSAYWRIVRSLEK